jgi:hypothetical protein
VCPHARPEHLFDEHQFGTPPQGDTCPAPAPTPPPHPKGGPQPPSPTTRSRIFWGLRCGCGSRWLGVRSPCGASKVKVKGRSRRSRVDGNPRCAWVDAPASLRSLGCDFAVRLVASGALIRVRATFPSVGGPTPYQLPDLDDVHSFVCDAVLSTSTFALRSSVVHTTVGRSGNEGFGPVSGYVVPSLLAEQAYCGLRPP